MRIKGQGDPGEVSLLHQWKLCPAVGSGRLFLCQSGQCCPPETGRRRYVKTHTCSEQAHCRSNTDKHILPEAGKTGKRMGNISVCYVCLTLSLWKNNPGGSPQVRFHRTHKLQTGTNYNRERAQSLKCVTAMPEDLSLIPS